MSRNGDKMETSQEPSTPKLNLSQHFFYELLTYAKRTYEDDVGKAEIGFLQKVWEATKSKEISDEESEEYSEEEELELSRLIKHSGELTQETSEIALGDDFNEINEAGAILRTLDHVAVYNSSGKAVLLDKFLEDPNASLKNSQLKIFGTVLSPLEDALIDYEQEKKVAKSDRDLVYEVISRGTGVGSGSSRKSSKNESLSMKLPVYNPEISREEAYEDAKKLKESTELPLVVGTIHVRNLGKLVTSGPYAENYHAPNHLFPVGYRSDRLYTSVLDPDKKVQYTSEILEGEKGPIFRVTHEDEFPVFEAASSSAVWLQVLRAVNEKKVSLGIQAKGTAISGPEMMGFANKKIASVLEGLDGALECQKYVFRAQRSGKSSSPSQILSEKRKRPSSVGSRESAQRVPKIRLRRSGIRLTAIGSDSTRMTRQRRSTHVSSLDDTFEELSRMLSNEVESIQSALNKAKKCSVNFKVLLETGLAKLVSRLRKHQEKSVAKLAKTLKAKWQDIVEDMNNSNNAAKDEANVLKIVDIISSFIGFGEDSVPSSAQAFRDSSAPRNQILSTLRRLKSEKPTVEDLSKSNIRKTLSRLRKHLDPEVSRLAKKVKKRWKQIYKGGESDKNVYGDMSKQEDDEDSAVDSETEKVGSSNNVHTNGDRNDERKVRKVAEKDRIVNEASVITAWKVRKRQRILIEHFEGLDVSFGRNHATLWLKTKYAKYRIAGQRLGLVPSHRYYPAYKVLWNAFQAISLPVLMIRNHPNIQELQFEEGMNTIISSAMTCPRPSSLTLDEQASKELISITNEDVIDFYEGILDQLTRLHPNREHVKNVYLKIPFIQTVVDLGNKKHAERKLRRFAEKRRLERLQALSPEERQKEIEIEKQRKREQFLKKIETGQGLPDDLEIQADDMAVEQGKPSVFEYPKPDLPLRPFPVFFDCEWTTIDVLTMLRMYRRSIEGRKKNHVDVKRFQVLPSDELDFRLPPERCQNIEYLFNKRREEIGDNFSRFLSCWLLCKRIRPVIEPIPEKTTPALEDYATFRYMLTHGQLSDLFVVLVQMLLKERLSASSTGSGDKVSSSSRAPAGSRNPGQNSSSKDLFFFDSKDAETYAYYRDELWPRNNDSFSTVSWPEFCRRLILDELLEVFEDNPARFLAENPLEMNDLYTQPDLLSRCDDLLCEILNNPSASSFSVPVDPVLHNAPNYFKIIHRPMDLGTIKHRLRSGHYDPRSLPYEVDYEFLIDEAIREFENGDEGNEDGETDSVKGNEEENDVEKEKNKLSERQKKKVAKLKVAEEKRKAHDREKALQLAIDDVYYKHDCKGGGHEGFAADMRQVWRNCETYNVSRTQIYQDSVKLKRLFGRIYKREIVDRDLRKKKDILDYFEEQHSEDFKTKDKIAEQSDERCKFILLMRESGDYAELPIGTKLFLMEWILNNLLESSKVKELLNPSVEKEKTSDDVEMDESDSKSKGSEEEKEEGSSEQAVNKPEYGVPNMEDNVQRVMPIGVDRYYNRYWIVNSILTSSGMIFVEHHSTHQWGYYDQFKDFKQFVDSLDIRGIRENHLSKVIKSDWLENLERCMKNAEKQNELEFKIVAGINEEERFRQEEEELQGKITYQERGLLKLQHIGSSWANATTEDGRPYYYNKETRETTWSPPQILKDIAEVEGIIKMLKEKKKRVRDTPLRGSACVKDGVTALFIRKLAELEPEPKQKSRRKGALDRKDLAELEFMYRLRAVKYRLLDFICDMLIMEERTIGPDSRSNLCPWKNIWLNEKRLTWLKEVDALILSLNRIQSTQSIMKRNLFTVKRLLRTLFRCYSGDTAALSSERSREVISRVRENEYRWMRALDRSETLAELGLLREQLAKIIGFSETMQIKHEKNQKLESLYVADGGLFNNLDNEE